MAIRNTNTFESFKPPVGSDGELQISRIVSQDEMFGHGRLFARNVLKPGAYLHWHKHNNEVEYYLVTRGVATFLNNEKEPEIAHPGDLCFMNPNEHHGIRNDGDEDVEIIALILNVTE